MYINRETGAYDSTVIVLSSLLIIIISHKSKSPPDIRDMAISSYNREPTIANNQKSRANLM